MGAESDVVDTLSRDAARKIVHVLMQTPASGGPIGPTHTRTGIRTAGSRCGGATT